MSIYLNYGNVKNICCFLQIKHIIYLNNDGIKRVSMTLDNNRNFEEQGSKDSFSKQY